MKRHNRFTHTVSTILTVGALIAGGAGSAAAESINAGPTGSSFYSVQLRGISNTPTGVEASVHVFDRTDDNTAYGRLEIVNGNTAQVLFDVTYGSYGTFLAPGSFDDASVGVLPYGVPLEITITGREFSNFQAILGATIVAEGGYAPQLPAPVDPVIWAGTVTLTTEATDVAFAVGSIPLPTVHDFTLGGFGAGPGQFDEPTDVKINPVTGDIVVVDQVNQRVQVFDANGLYLFEMGDSGTASNLPGLFSSPRAVAFNPLNGDMYITDTDNDRVQVFDSSGAFLFQFGSTGNGPGQLDFPTGIVFNAAFGNVVQVVDSGNNRIHNFSSLGASQGFFGILGSGPGEFDFPVGICLDGSGQIYVTERNNHRVQHLEPTGFYLGEFGSFGSGPGQFNNPIAVQVRPGSGQVFVSDWLNHRIQVFDAGGNYITHTRGVGAGVLSGMEGICFRNFNTYLVANGFNYTVEQFTILGILENNSIAERNGELYLSAHDVDGMDLVFGTNENDPEGLWQFERVDTAFNTGHHSSLAIDNNGDAHIAYHESSPLPGVRYATNASGSWVLTEVLSAGGDAFGSHTSLALNSLGEPGIAYADDATGQLGFSQFTGGAWFHDPDVQGANGVTGTSLQFDQNDQPHILYTENGTVPNRVRYQIGAGAGTWLRYDVDAGFATGYPSLVLVDSANPHMSYMRGNEMWYAIRDPLQPGQFINTLIEVAPNGIGVAGLFSNIAIQPITGQPRIVYESLDDTATSLRYASLENGNWNISTFDFKGNDDFLHTSMTMDPAGNAHVVYRANRPLQAVTPGLNLAEVEETAATTAIQVDYVTPNTVRNTGTADINVFGPNVALNPPSAAQLEGETTTLVATGVATTGPDHLTLTFDFTAAPLGGYDLILVIAGPDTLLHVGAVVVHDEVPELTRLSTHPSRDRFARYTKEGVTPTLIGFMSGRTGNQGLYAKEPGDADTDALGPILLSDSYAPSFFDWSPDATRIAFRNDFDEMLYTLDVATSEATPELAGSNVLTVAWSPDGSQIAFDQGTLSSPVAIKLIEPGTDIITTLTNPQGLEAHFGADWSPDGARIAFVRGDSLTASYFDILSMSSTLGESGGFHTLIANGARNGSPAWSPDGKWIAFVSDQAGNNDIYIMNSNGARYGLIQITSDTANDSAPQWNPDGTHISFESDRAGPGTSDIFEADVSGLLVDSDGDGVPDVLDNCVAIAPAAGEIDRDFDGCPDPTSSFRMTRFWSEDQLPVTFETDAIGDASITDDSEFTVLQESFDAWRTGALAGVTLAGGDDGTRAGLSDAVSGDGRNSISFSDPDAFDYGVLATTFSTVAAEDTLIAGRHYRENEIIDSDILFNTFWYDFGTPTFSGPVGAFSLGSVATHELGHFFGFRHTCVERSTMFYVVRRSDEQASPELDDISLALRGYQDSNLLPLPLAVTGRVLRGEDGTTPVVGAGVFAIDEATGDTLQMTVTDLQGVYKIYAPTTTDIRIYILPVDGSESVNGLGTQDIGLDFFLVAETDFLGEFYDGPGETNSDFGAPGIVLNSGSFPIVGADILTNPDLSPPSVVFTSPAEGETVSANLAVTVKFDDRINLGSVTSSSFRLVNVLNGVGVSGLATVLSNDSLLVFTPNAPLEFNTGYLLRVGPGIADQFGNAMLDSVLVNFDVGLQPPVTVTGLSPAEATVGGTLVIEGTGFDNGTPANNEVFIEGGVSALAFAATLEQLFITVPTGAVSGSLQVVVGGTEFSNGFPITIVPPKGIPAGTPLTPAAILPASPRRVVVGPSGVWAYVATATGVSAVKALPTDANFMTEIVNISLGGGSRGVVAMPDGRRVLTVSSSPPQLNVIDSDPTSLFLNQVDATATVSLIAEPLGIEALPGGSRVGIVYQDRVVAYNSTEGAAFGLPTRQWYQAGVFFTGDVGVSADAMEAYASTTDGRIAVLGLQAGEGIVALIGGGTSPRELAGRPDASGFLNVDETGDIRAFSPRGPQVGSASQDGGYTGLTISPEGTYAYGANFILNRIDVYNVATANPVGVASIPTGVDPTDVTTGSSGRYIYVTTDQNDLLEVYDTEDGPVIETVFPSSGGTGTLITLIGEGFDPVVGNNQVTIGGQPGTVESAAADGSSLVVRQPANANQSGIFVQAGPLTSNTRPYRVVSRADAGNLALVSRVPGLVAGDFRTLRESPTGEYLLGVDGVGALSVIGADPAKERFLRPIDLLSPTDTGMDFSSDDLEFSPDGSRLYYRRAGGGIGVADVLPNFPPNPIVPQGFITDDGAALTGIARIAMTPDGRWLLGANPTTGNLYLIDPASDAVDQAFGAGSAGVGALAVHPDGKAAFVGALYVGDGVVFSIDLDPASPGYLTQIGITSLTSASVVSPPLQLVVSPDGTALFALTLRAAAVTAVYTVHRIDIDPASPNYLFRTHLAEIALDAQPVLAVNHSGTVLFATDPNDRVIEAYSALDLTSLGASPVSTRLAGATSIVVSRDDGRVYAPALGSELQVMDVTAISGMNMVSGNGQIGVANQPLSAPIVIGVTDGNAPLTEGAFVEYFAQPTSGYFGDPTNPDLDGDGFPDQRFYAAADMNGLVSTPYVAGPGAGQDTVNVLSSVGVLAINFTVVADTSLAPPQILSVLPATGSTPGVNTDVAIDFSKAINMGTVSQATFNLRLAVGGTPLAGTYASALGGKRIVFKSGVPLDYSTDYEFEATTGLQDYSGNPLTNPGIFSFTTAAAPAGPTLSTVQPTSGIPGNTVVLAGSGFSRVLADNTILFGGISVTPRSGDPGALTAVIPYGASSGDIRVVVNGTAPDTTNAIPFGILPTSTAPVSEVVASVSVPSSGQQIVSLPNGSRAYMTSAGANTVVPINLTTETSESAVSVGLSPFGIAAGPGSRRAYVTNFLSNTISVIATDQEESATLNTVVQTLAAGPNPTGIAVHPDGRTLYVVNYGDSTLDLIDIDPTSATYGSARSTKDTSSGAKAVTITADGATVLVGTPFGLEILNADGTARSSADVSGGARAVTVTSDGGLAVVLTETDQLVLVDLSEGLDPGDRARSTKDTSSGSKALTIAADNAHVYVTAGDNTVLVYQISVLAGGAALADRAGGSYSLELVDTILVGENPFGIAIVPDGSGRILVVNSGSLSVSIINASEITAGEFTTMVQFDPNSVNLSSKGKYLSAAVQFPPYLDPLDADVKTVRLQSVIHADTSQVSLTDKNGDGINEIEFKFLRSEVFEILPEGQNVHVTITGLHDGRVFTATDSISVFRPHMKTPKAGSVVAPLAETSITWDSIQGGADHVDIHLSTDLGETWAPVVEGTEDDGTYTWSVPDVQSTQAQLMLIARDSKNKSLGYEITAGAFTIGQAVVGVEDEIPLRFALLPAAPNPFAASTQIRFELPDPAPVTLRVFGIDGSVVRTLSDHELYPAGKHSLFWDGKNANGQVTAAGVYFVRIQSGDKNQAVTKMVRVSR